MGLNGKYWYLIYYMMDHSLFSQDISFHFPGYSFPLYPLWSRWLALLQRPLKNVFPLGTQNVNLLIGMHAVETKAGFFSVFHLFQENI